MIECPAWSPSRPASSAAETVSQPGCAARSLPGRRQPGGCASRSRSACRPASRKDIGPLLRERGRRPSRRGVPELASERGRADERRNVRGDRGGGIASGFLPALLLGCRAVEDQVPGRTEHHRVGVEVPEPLLALEAPRQEDGKRHLVELHARPVWFAVDPEVLGEAPVRVLADGQVDAGAERRFLVSGRQEARGGTDEVAGPDEVISPAVVVALRFAPGNGQRSDEGAGIRLVLVCQQQAVAAPIEIPFVV